MNSSTIRWDGTKLEIGKIYVVENAMTGGVHPIAPDFETYQKCKDNWRYWLDEVMKYNGNYLGGNPFGQTFFEGFGKAYEVVEKDNPTTYTQHYTNGDPPTTWVNNYPIKLRSPRTNTEFWINAYGTAFTPSELDNYRQAQKEFVSTLQPWRKAIAAKRQAFENRELWKAEIRAIGGVPRIDNSSGTKQAKSIQKRDAVLAVLHSYNDAYSDAEQSWRAAKKIRFQAYLKLKAAERALENARNTGK